MANSTPELQYKTLLTQGTITINPSDFSATTGGYIANFSISLNGFYTSFANKGDVAAAPLVPSVEIVHAASYAGGGSWGSYFTPAPFTRFSNRSTGVVSQQLDFDLSTDYTPANNPQYGGFLSGRYFTNSNSSSFLGSSYFTQYIMYKLYSPSFTYA